MMGWPAGSERGDERPTLVGRRRVVYSVCVSLVVCKCGPLLAFRKLLTTTSADLRLLLPEDLTAGTLRDIKRRGWTEPLVT